MCLLCFRRWLHGPEGSSLKWKYDINLREEIGIVAQSHSTSLPQEWEKLCPTLVTRFLWPSLCSSHATSLSSMLKSTEVGLNIHCKDSEASFNKDIAFWWALSLRKSYPRDGKRIGTERYQQASGRCGDLETWLAWWPQGPRAGKWSRTHWWVLWVDALSCTQNHRAEAALLWILVSVFNQVELKEECSWLVPCMTQRCFCCSPRNLAELARAALLYDTPKVTFEYLFQGLCLSVGHSIQSAFSGLYVICCFHVLATPGPEDRENFVLKC